MYHLGAGPFSHRMPPTCQSLDDLRHGSRDAEADLLSLAHELVMLGEVQAPGHQRGSARSSPLSNEKPRGHGAFRGWP